MITAFVLSVLQSPAPSSPGDILRPTKEGAEALAAIIDRCVESGSMRLVKRGGSPAPVSEVADSDRLAVTIQAERARISPALVDTPVGDRESFDDAGSRMAIALLSAIGQGGSDRAGSFGAP
jgi:hypothetical protein